MGESLRRKVVNGVFWRLVTRLSTQGVTFVVGILLARMLGPEAYGTIALLAIFISLAEEVANAGFGAALVQRKSVTDIDYNSAFYLQMSLALLVYAVLYFLAPRIAAFYDNDQLVAILRVQALILPIHAVRGVQSAILSRELKFYLSFRIGLAEVICSGVVGLMMAYSGYGVWALVCSALAGGFAGMVSTVIWIRWVPKLMFSFAAVREMFSYGWKLLASSLVDNFFGNLYGLVIGKFYTVTDLALYNRGRQFPNLAMDTINSSLSVVAFPALAKVQGDPARLRDGMRKMIQVSTFFVMPMLAGMSAVSEPFIQVVLGDQWLGAAPYLAIACVSFAFYPFHTINLQAIKAIGRSDYYLKLSIIKDILSVVVLFVSCRYSVIMMALAGAFVSTPASLVINSWPNRKLLNYGILSQLSDVIPTLLLSLLMAAIAWSVKFTLVLSPICLLCTQIIVGVVSFYALILVFRPKGLYLVCEGLPMCKRFFPKFVFEGVC